MLHGLRYYATYQWGYIRVRSAAKRTVEVLKLGVLCCALAPAVIIEVLLS